MRRGGGSWALLGLSPGHLFLTPVPLGTENDPKCCGAGLGPVSAMVLASLVPENRVFSVYPPALLLSINWGALAEGIS